MPGGSVNFFKPFLPVICTAALAFAEASGGGVPDSKIFIPSLASELVPDDKLRALSAPQLNRLSLFFKQLTSFMQAHSLIIDSHLSRNHKSTLENEILPKLANIPDKAITVTKSEPVQNRTESGIETGSVIF